MSDQIVSPFRMHDWQIQDFQFRNPVIVYPKEGTPPVWKLAFHKEFGYHEDQSSYIGIIAVRFSVTLSAKTPAEEHPFVLSGTAVSLSSLKAEKDLPDVREQMDRLLSINATSYTLGALRSFLITQSGFLMNKQLILPSINLNNLEFEKEYTIS